jgi:hypothetical protein
VLTQFVSPDDEHDGLETCRVKNKNKCIVKNVRHVGRFNKNHNTMHGQQNVKDDDVVWTPFILTFLYGLHCRWQHGRCVLDVARKRDYVSFVGRRVLAV